ncbi:PTS sugar transporter subunit IIA [Anaerococcus porci]|uniref:PTS sugar transporter subunit IIA n=1 Tax=Anaerococcus porci TaxID=2652269 RepID=UPI002A74E115|nr:PTS sugar transporter subunit IIA [Anaerococcus porci]MDY3006704.1 PTS sugar transporter subunit IIA [Anaerococcus porci]
MINEIIKNGLYDFYEEIDTWQEAIEKSCEKLIEKNIVDERYPKQIIETVEKYGPYIVLVPRVAMPHCQEKAEGVNDTAVAFMKVNKAVCFDEDDRDKDACIFFTIASENPDKHLENISEISEILGRDEIIDALEKVENIDDLIRVQKEFDI